MIVNDLPEAGKIGPVGSALVHQNGSAVLQGPVHDIGVAGYPADVGRAPVNVVVAQIEDVFCGDVGLHGVAARGVQQAFGLSG